MGDYPEPTAEDTHLGEASLHQNEASADKALTDEKEPDQNSEQVVSASAKGKGKKVAHGKGKCLKDVAKDIAKRKAEESVDEAQKKLRMVEVEVDETEASGPSLFGNQFIPFSKVLDGEGSYPLSSFRPDTKMGINDRLTTDTALEFAYNTIPRRNRKLLRRMESTSLHQSLALGVAQVMGLATEAIVRRDYNLGKLDELTIQAEADKIELSTISSLLKTEEERSAKFSKEIKLLKNDLSTTRSSNKELETANAKLLAELEFLKGDGSSQIISNFLSSNQGRDLLIHLCAPARNLGYHKALVAIAPRFPELVITAEKGYNVNADGALNKAFADLKLMKVDGRQYVPPMPQDKESV